MSLSAGHSSASAGIHDILDDASIRSSGAACGCCDDDLESSREGEQLGTGESDFAGTRPPQARAAQLMDDLKAVVAALAQTKDAARKAQLSSKKFILESQLKMVARLQAAASK